MTSSHNNRGGEYRWRRRVTKQLSESGGTARWVPLVGLPASVFERSVDLTPTRCVKKACGTPGIWRGHRVPQRVEDKLSTKNPRITHPSARYRVYRAVEPYFATVVGEIKGGWFVRLDGAKTATCL